MKFNDIPIIGADVPKRDSKEPTLSEAIAEVKTGASRIDPPVGIIKEMTIPEKLDKHAIEKLQEAVRLFEEPMGSAVAKIAIDAISMFAQLNCSRDHVQFVQDWIDEVGLIVKPNIIPVKFEPK